MTDEEKKAIEYFKENINYFQEQIKFIETVDCDYYDEEYELYKNRVKQFNTVLNLIQKQQAELEEWKIEYNHWCQLAIDRKKELEKKDKIIDLMAEELESQFNHCEPCWLDNEVECKNYTNCIDCIKQYFEKKVEGK